MSITNKQFSNVILSLINEIDLGRGYGFEYTAYILDDESHKKLVAFAPKGWAKYSHHMTIIGPRDQKYRLPSHWHGWNKPIKISRIAQNDQIMTALVDIGDVPIPFKGPEYPHITIATNTKDYPSVRPEMSNDFSIGDFKDLPGGPIMLTGEIEEVLRQPISESWDEEKSRKRTRDSASKKDKQVLYHIAERPGEPRPKTRRGSYDSDDLKWERPWLDKPVKSGIFMSPDPLGVTLNHPVSGNVYAYKVPKWVIAKAGGINRYDRASEVVISKEIWDEAGNEIEFLGMKWSADELDKRATDKYSVMKYGNMSRGSRKKPGWITAAEWDKQNKNLNDSGYVEGLRKTKHLDYAIKAMSTKEKHEALAAFEDKNKRVDPAFRSDLVIQQRIKDKEVMASLEASLYDDERHKLEETIRDYISRQE